MNVIRARMLVLMVVIMGGFATVIAGKKYKTKVIVTSDTPEVAFIETLSSNDSTCNRDNYSRDNGSSDSDRGDTVTGCIGAGACEIAHSRVSEIVSIPVVSTSKRAQKRNQNRRVRITQKEPVVQEWEVIETQHETKQEPHGATQAYSRAQKYKLKQEKHAQVRQLTHDLQAILLINPLEHTVGGLVRSTDENKLLAVQLADIAHALQDAGFKVNMTHIIAKIDELNEEPGTLNALARDYARQVEDWKEAHAYQVREVQYRDMIIFEQEQKIRTLEEQRELLIIKKEQIQDHTGKLKEELKKARHDQMSSEQLAAQAQAETAQAQEMAQKALEQVQEAHVQMHKVHEDQGTLVYQAPETLPEEKKQPEPTTDITTDTEESEATVSTEQTPEETIEITSMIEKESAPVTEEESTADDTTISMEAVVEPTSEKESSIVSSESVDKSSDKEESETVAPASEKEEKETAVAEAAQETETIVPAEGKDKGEEAGTTETENKPAESAESTTTEEAATPVKIKGEAEAKESEDVSSFTPDWHK